MNLSLSAVHNYLEKKCGYRIRTIGTYTAATTYLIDEDGRVAIQAYSRTMSGSLLKAYIKTIEMEIEDMESLTAEGDIEL
jgi:hypothetical protein